MNETRKNTITSTKQAIKDMLLQDSEITKILLGNKENNYKNVKELLGKNIYDHLISFSRLEDNTYIFYNTDLRQKFKYEDTNAVSVSIIITSTVINYDENYNNHIDLLSERISNDIFDKWDSNYIRNYSNSAITYDGFLARNISFQISVDYI